MAIDISAFDSTVNMNPLLRAIEGYRQGVGEQFKFQNNQKIGGAIARGDTQGAMSAAAEGGSDVPTLMAIAEKHRAEMERQRQEQALAQMKSNPEIAKRMNPAFAAALEALPAEQRATQYAEVTNPITREKLDIQRMQARQHAQDQYGKAGTIVQDKDGTFYSVQFGSNGQKIVAPLQFNGTGLTPAKGTEVVGDTIIDKTTGRDIRNVAPNIAGGAAAKEVGEARGKATVDLPRIVDNATLMLKTIEQARVHPGRDAGTGPVGGRLPAIGGQQAGFVALTDQIQGKAFLEAFNSLKGGGQITEVEGTKATNAIARLNRVQNKADYDAALRDLEDVVRLGLSRAQRNGQQPRAPAPAANMPQPGQIIDHPAGRFLFKGGDPADKNNYEAVK